MSPVRMIFVPCPTRVITVFTSSGVRFWASSTMMYWFGMLRPRMYVSGSTPIRSVSWSASRFFCAFSFLPLASRSSAS